MKKLACFALVLALLCASALAEAGLTSFTTTDTQGNTVTQGIFADYDLTVVNVWATWCPYCIEEMPSFSQLVEMLPENVNFITVCEDADAQPELTAEILESAGANFQTLVVNQEISDQFLSYIMAFPTTYFLDSAGVPLTQTPLKGVPSMEDPAGAYLEIVNYILEQMGL